MSSRRALALGAAAGAASPLILQGLLVGAFPSVGLMVTIALIGATLGAGLSSGLLGVAKRARAEHELDQGVSPLGLESGSAPDSATS